MTSPTVKPRQNRAKRREAMLNSVAKLVGCLAVVVAVACVFYVACRQIWRSPAVDPVYEQMAGEVPWVPLEKAPPSEQPEATAPAAPPGASDRPVIAAVPVQQAAPAENSVSYEGKRQEIEQTTQKFFAARSILEKVPFCRDAERVRPLMEAYYQRHPLKAPTLQKLGWMLPVKEPGYRLVFVQALFHDRAPLSLIAEESADGTFRIDWESSVRYSEIDWKDFLSERPGQPKLFRVIASKSSRPPAPGSQHREALELKHPAEKGTVTAYFDRDDPQFKPLIEQLQLRNWKDVPLTLRLCYPNSKTDGGAVRIAGIEGQGWLILENTRS
jgi:hypothetical protein